MPPAVISLSSLTFISLSRALNSSSSSCYLRKVEKEVKNKMERMIRMREIEMEKSTKVEKRMKM